MDVKERKEKLGKLLDQIYAGKIISLCKEHDYEEALPLTRRLVLDHPENLPYKSSLCLIALMRSTHDRRHLKVIDQFYLEIAQNLIHYAMLMDPIKQSHEELLYKALGPAHISCSLTETDMKVAYPKRKFEYIEFIDAGNIFLIAADIYEMYVNAPRDPSIRLFDRNWNEVRGNEVTIGPGKLQIVYNIRDAFMGNLQKDVQREGKTIEQYIDDIEEMLRKAA